MDADFDVENIKEIVVSEPKQHPHNTDIIYSTCLLLNRKDPYQPFLAIHTKPGKKVLGKAWEGEMREWVLTANGKSKRHTIVKNNFPTNRRKYIDTER